MGHAIRAGDPRLCRIDVSIPGFLTQKNVIPVELPPVLALPEATALREETASSRLSLEEEIDRFRLEKEKEEQGDLIIHISDQKDESDRILGIRTRGLVLAKIDNNFEEEEKEKSLNPRNGLKDLLTGRSKGSSSKKAPKSQPLSSLPSPPLVTSLLPIPNLKKKSKEQELEEGEVVCQETKK